jgi:hypothetical protein
MSISKVVLAVSVMMLMAGTAQAGLWSSGNGIGSVGGSAAVLVSFTGDGQTTDAQVDIVVPNGFAASVTPLNGATCVVFAGTPTRPAVVRLLTPASSTPLPVAATNLCRITLSIQSSALSGRFQMFFDECANPTVGSGRCELDPGYITVRP